MTDSRKIVESTFIPIRRALARTLDQTLLAMGWISLQVFVLGIKDNLVLSSIVFYLAFNLIFLLLEPTLLCSWGTTPGKAVLGIYVRDNYGDKLTWRKAFRRTVRVWTGGMGLNLVPISTVILMVRLWQVLRGNDLPWDYDSSVLVRDDKKIRYLLFVALVALLVFLNIYLGSLLGKGTIL